MRVNSDYTGGRLDTHSVSRVPRNTPNAYIKVMNRHMNKTSTTNILSCRPITVNNYRCETTNGFVYLNAVGSLAMKHLVVLANRQATEKNIIIIINIIINMLYDQRQVRHTYFHQSSTMLQPHILVILPSSAQRARCLDEYYTASLHP